VSEAPPILIFSHGAMATTFELRIASDEKDYVAGASRECFELLDRMDERMNRYHPSSDLSEIAALPAGGSTVVAFETWRCLQRARGMEEITDGAFSPTHRDRDGRARWTLEPGGIVRVLAAPVRLDLGAIAKGFALDVMGELLREEWKIAAWMLVAGGSTILIGERPAPDRPWETRTAGRLWRPDRLAVSGSGTAQRGAHVLDPRTGDPAPRASAWAFAPTAAEADAWSTAAMILSDRELDAMNARGDVLLLAPSGPALRRWGALKVEPERRRT
jgi:FAD:protein FMN transferase